jgi:predicted PurR-regulated permease PerM
MKDYPMAVRYLVRIMLIFAVVTVLSITRQLLVPLAFSIFMAYLLFPAAAWLENKGVPRIPTNFLVILSFMAIVIGTIFLISELVTSASNDIPQLKEQLTANLKALQEAITSYTGLSSDQLKDVVTTAGLSGDYFTTIIEIGRNTVIALALVPVYTFLLLFYRNKFRKFVSMMVKEKNEDTASEIIEKVSEVVPKYLKGLVVVCFTLVFLNWLGFEITGVKYPLLMGLIAALFNLIPYLGTVIGYGVVFIFAFIVQSPSVAGAVAIQFFIVQFIENNILTPNITGSYVRINPLVIIFSLIAGGLIWGLPGMFLVIPTLGILKIVCESIESLKPYAFLMGIQGTEHYSITVHSLRKRFGWEEK